jgi:pimeloyl-ACP methyl ester carboxylesterase
MWLTNRPNNPKSGNFGLSSTQPLAANVTGITVPLSGHWIPEEQPQFVIEQLTRLFSE